MNALLFQRERAFGLLRFVCRFKIEYSERLLIWNKFEQQLMDNIRNGTTEDLVSLCDYIADDILSYLVIQMEGAT